MKINNPRSMVDYTRSYANSTEQNPGGAYNLATVGQLKNAIDRLETQVIKWLDGANAAAGAGSMKGGLADDNNFGYAWLNKEGKVDPSLMPAIAISETFVLSESDLVKGYETLEGIPAESLLNDYVIRNINGGDNILPQKGDIFIVNANMEERKNPSGEIVEVPGFPNPKYAGSYILTRIVNKDDKDAPPTLNYDNQSDVAFIFSRLAYSDSNIVKINGYAPKNQTGELRLELKHILQTRNYSFNSGDNDTTDILGSVDLENTIYRLATITNDPRSTDVRFGFIKSLETGTAEVIPYAKLSELDELSGKYENSVNILSAAITGLRTDAFETIESVSSVLSTVLSEKDDYLDERITTDKQYFDGLIGDTTSYIFKQHSKADLETLLTNDRETINNHFFDDFGLPSSTVIGNLCRVHDKVKSDFALLERTRTQLNGYLTNIKDDIGSLYNNLNQRAIEVKEYELIWSDEDKSGDVVRLNAADPKSMYMRTSNDVVGVQRWKHRYQPNGSEEYVLGIFDKDTGEQLCPDVTRVNNAGKFVSYEISVDTEVVQTGEDTEVIGSLIGKKWIIITAKIITGINKPTILGTETNPNEFHIGEIVNVPAV